MLYDLEPGQRAALALSSSVSPAMVAVLGDMGLVPGEGRAPGPCSYADFRPGQIGRCCRSVRMPSRLVRVGL